MAKQIEIQIPNPCHEDWNNMTIEAQGRHCNSCKKTVIDFSLMNDEQLVNFFKSETSHVCGRISIDQVNKEILIPARKIPWLTYFFQVSIPLFLLSLKTTAQNKLESNVTEISLPKKKASETPKSEQTQIIKGSVKTDKGIPISYASILIRGTQKGTVTDTSGNFSISIKGFEKFIQVSVVGYEMKMIEVEPGKSFYDITLNESNRMLLGLMVTVRSTKKSKKKKEVAPVVCTQENKMLIYPNPISLNSILTIKWDYAVNEKQLVEIYSISGELIQKENVIVNKYSNTTTIQLAIKNTGNYIVRATDLKTHKFLTTQLLVN